MKAMTWAEISRRGWLADVAPGGASDTVAMHGHARHTLRDYYRLAAITVVFTPDA